MIIKLHLIDISLYPHLNPFWFWNYIRETVNVAISIHIIIFTESCFTIQTLTMHTWRKKRIYASSLD